MTETTKRQQNMGIFLLIALIPTIATMTISFVVINYYDQQQTSPLQDQVDSILNHATRFNNDTQLSQQDRLDLLVKNHAISLNDQSKINLLQKQYHQVEYQYWYIPLITSMGSVVGFIYVANRSGY